MRSKSSNTFRTCVMMTEENRILADKFFGGFSDATNRGIELMATFNISVYVIKHKFEKRFFIGIYDRQEVPDVAYHYVHDLGSNTLGAQIRDEGLPFFGFQVIGKFCDIREARAVKKMFKKMYLKAGYTLLNDGFDLVD